MKDYTKRVFIALSMIVVGILVVVMLNNVLSSPFLKARIIGYDLETHTYLTSIQTMMWVVFFVALGELLFRLLIVLRDEKGFNKHYLPENSYDIIEIEDLPNIANKIESDTKFGGGLADFIQKLVMQFQTSKSIEQTLSMLNAQLEMRGSVVDLNYNMIRYLSWLIPTLGFIGTVVGIADALAYAGKVNGQGATFVADLTQKLAVAFDTTFVALVMSAVIVFLMHIIQGREENNLTRIGQYCLDNFINRLYLGE